MKNIDFKDNEEIPLIDVELYKNLTSNPWSDKEKEFIENLIYKEIYEYPISKFDVIMREKDNADGIFIDKCYTSEYKIGRKRSGKTETLSIYPQSLSEALSLDLYEILDEHIRLIDWLRRIDYCGINYDFKWEE